MDRKLSGTASIAGIGATEFSKDSGRTEMRLAVEASLAALNDAGIEPAEVDGICTFTMDNNPEVDLHRMIGGRELKFFTRINYGGGGAAAPLMQAMMAIATGAANVVLCFRAMNERSWYRFGAGTPSTENPQYTNANHYAWYLPAGLNTPASYVGMAARRYMHKYGATSEDYGRVSVSARAFAATNPKAFFYQKPITLEEHQASRWIVEPLHLLDCCQESDGAVALIVTSTERARKLKSKPAVIRAAAQGATAGQHRMTSYYERDDLTGNPEMGLVARQLWEQSGLGPRDIQSAIIYDHFTPFVLTQLEEFGFCGRGEAKDFLRSGEHTRTGSLPINPNGGQLGEAYIHGMNGIAEAVRQIRGTAVNQLSGIENMVITAGTGVPTSGLILGKD
ncbi:MAG: lipid-transfer protein [Flavobacteriaceae bacterium]